MRLLGMYRATSFRAEMLRLLQLAAAFLLAFSTGSVLSVNDGAGATETSTFSRIVQATVINAFANVSVNAFISFEGTQVNRLKYGQSRVVGVNYKQHDDFIIQFKKEVTDEPVPELEDYGFLQEPATDYTQAYLIIHGRSGNIQRLQHAFLAFDSSTVGEEFSKLYFFNGLAVQRNDPRLYVYALYQRANADGSFSESITQLATGLQTSSGRDIDLEPSLQLHIKAFPSVVNSVKEFKEKKELVEYPEFLSLPGKRQVMIGHGHYNNTLFPPKLLLLAATEDSISFSLPTRSSLFVILLMLLGVTMVTV